MKTHPLAQPHAVYVLYGPADLILYIGVTKNPRARFAVHKCKNKKTWWPLVTRHDLDWYPDAYAARRVETVQLRLHRPICNPVIPDENGKHTTVTRGRIPVRSLWDQMTMIASVHDETVDDLMIRAIERELARLRRTKPAD